MARLDIQDLVKRYGDFHAVRDVSLSIENGEFLVLLGPSGCGKTTTLRMVAGFIEPTSGSVRLGGADITRLPPWKRNAGMVFQNYALFPHMTVAENVAFGLEMRKVPKADIARRVEETLALVRLAGYGGRLPRQCRALRPRAGCRIRAAPRQDRQADRGPSRRAPAAPAC